MPVLQVSPVGFRDLRLGERNSGWPLVLDTPQTMNSNRQRGETVLGLISRLTPGGFEGITFLTTRSEAHGIYSVHRHTNNAMKVLSFILLPGLMLALTA